MERKCKNCYMPLGVTQTECSNCGALNPLPQGAYSTQANRVPFELSPESYSMKWFKFVIYFQLFASCVLSVINGVGLLNGVNYGGMMDQLYEKCPTLKDADSFYAIASFLMAGFALVVRFRLAGYHRDGPVLYLVMLVANVVVVGIYALMIDGVGSVTIGSGFPYYDYTVFEFDAWPSVISSFVSSGVLFVCNAIYFGKRSELFEY